MKNLKITFAVLSMFFLSCDNESIIDNETKESISLKEKSITSSKKNVPSNLYYEIVDLDDTTEQLLVASSLSPENMYDLWLIKIADFKENNNLNKNQIEFLTNFERELSPKIFNDSPERKKFDISQKMTLAKKLFGENEGWYFLTKVENINHRIEKIKTNNNAKYDTGGGTIEACDCTKNSDCTRITGIGIDGVSWEYGTCSGESCYRETYFFGMFESSDNTRCVY